MVRLPRYAGHHYFVDPGRLRASVESFVEDAAAASVPGALCAIIVPHGAHPEFGPIAGHGYKLLLSVPLTSELTVLLAPAAVIPDDRGAVLCDPADAYATPLDLIGVAAPALDELGRMGLTIARMPDEEPVIENHLPFIQVVMGDTQCLPLRVPAGADLTAPAWDVAASRFGLIIAAANPPPPPEQRAFANRLAQQAWSAARWAFIRRKLAAWLGRGR
jgi:AmmeMemoRadiSam system protein B